MRVCIGGTFNVVHKGHQRLIKQAFSIAGPEGFVFIGIAINDLVAQKKQVKSFEARKDQLVEFINKKKPVPTVVIEPITNKFGPTLKQDFDVIVVSPETISVAREINKERQKKGKKQMKIVQIPFILADDGKPIRSTRIINGEIKADGTHLSSGKN